MYPVTGSSPLFVLVTSVIWGVSEENRAHRIIRNETFPTNWSKMSLLLQEIEALLDFDPVRVDRLTWQHLDHS